MLHESIGFIPLSQRKGRSTSLFFTWFASNMQLTTIVTGALAVTMHLQFASAVVAILIGNGIGAAVMGLHAAQGPRMVAPQMVYSRNQFGTKGASMPVFLFILMYIGFYASTSVIGGQMLAQVFHIPYPIALILVNLITVLLVYLGHDVISSFQRIASYFYAAAFAFLSFKVYAASHVSFHFHDISISGVLTMLPLVATWQLSYTPYVSDYSRYLMPNTRVEAISWFAGLGTFISTGWMMTIGAAGAYGFSQSQISSGRFLMLHVPTGLQWILYALLFLGIVSVNVFNLYGGFMSIMAMFPQQRSASSARRITLLLSFFVICTTISLFSSSNFMNKYSTFLSILLNFLIPWSAINLADFYLVNRGYTSLGLRGTGKRIQSVRLDTFLVYVVAICMEFTIYFLRNMNSALVSLANLSWLIGFLCSGILYLWVRRRTKQPPGL